LPLVRKISPILVALTLLLSAIAPTGVAAIKPPKDVNPRPDSVNYNNGVALPFSQGETHTKKPPLGPAKVGDVRTWLGLDDFRGSIGLKNYTLRGVGNHVEVWVANNLKFPNPQMLNPLTPDPTDFFTYNDCRNTALGNPDPRVVIDDEQVGYLIDQFDNNIYTTEADWWSTPPKRDGHKAVLPKVLGVGSGSIGISSAEYRGEGDNVVVLVDNVRDSNFYDKDNEHTNSYIAGFYYSVFDDYFDRTVMSVDAWDWLHRTGADPVHEPSPDPCTSAPARPYLYESVFAHEYQHLLHHYTDPDEISWVNEGLSDFTEVITGYSDPSKHPDEKGHDSHTNAFLGWEAVAHPSWNPIAYESGPENGLTAWEDQGPDEILADYGFAYFFMNFVNSRGLGQDFFTSWQHNQANGIAGLDAALADAGSSETFADLWSDATISALVDGYVDQAGATVDGADAADLTNDATDATVLINDNANATPGAPPWGSDYIDLGAGAGLSTVAFDGDDHGFPGPQWVVDDDGYFTNPDDPDTGVYRSLQDISIARDVSGHDGEELTFDHYYAMELGWDFGFVQVSTDGGDTWQSLPCDGTTSDHNPDAFANIVANVPGYTGPTDNPADHSTTGTADLPISVSCGPLPAGVDYLAFRFMSDPAAEFDGWHVKNVQLDGIDLGTPGDLTGWDSQSFFTTVDLSYAFTLVGLNGTVSLYGDVTGPTAVRVLRTTLGSDDEISLTDLSAFAGYARVVAIVSAINVSDSSRTYQPYSMLVNGVEMADGG
jgi:hypothetical protein